MWAGALPVTRDAEVSGWLQSRRLDPAAVELWDLARALPSTVKLPRWAWTKAGGRWTASGHRLLVRVWNATGTCGALRARSVHTETQPAKSLAPVGARMTGLVMACPLAVQVLAGATPTWWTAPCFIISEGEPDFLTWASRQPEGVEHGPAVIGVEAGAWTAALAARIPENSRVVIRTHHDGAGETYAQRIADSLEGRCELLRSIDGGQR